MKTLTKEWIDKAEADWRTARREVKVTSRPSYDAVCFHTQQCAEKYLKAYLQDHDIAFPRTHDLIKLVDLCNTHDGMFAVLQRDLNLLNDYSVDIRYPSETADQDEAREAVKAMDRTRKFIRKKLGLR